MLSQFAKDCCVVKFENIIEIVEPDSKLQTALTFGVLEIQLDSCEKVLQGII